MVILRKATLLIVFVLLLLPFVTAAAQDDEPVFSEGCTALDGLVGAAATGEFATVVYEFVEGDEIRVTITGTGTEFALLESGSIAVGPIPVGQSLVYVIPADGDYLFSVEVAGFGVDTEVTFSCVGVEIQDEDGGGGIVIPSDGNVTLCHYPPGNPAAAHTITVGAPAVATHISQHGDTLGACPTSVQTRHDDSDDGNVIFVIPQTGEISVWGSCVGDSCSSVVNVNVTEITIINTVIVVDGSPQFVVIDEPGEVQEELDENPDDNSYAVIYYLHPDPADPTVGVFQINVYVNGLLVSDSVLVFIDVNSTIVRWTTHSYWTEAAEGDET